MRALNLAHAAAAQHLDKAMTPERRAFHGKDAIPYPNAYPN
jgi:hypothetical protein